MNKKMNKKKIALATTVGVLTLAIGSISVSAKSETGKSIGKIFTHTTSAKVNLDKDGNVVDSKGNIVKTKAQFEQDQKKYTKEHPYTVEVGQDGKIIENGVPVAQSSDVAVVEYAHIDENGNLVDDKGNILAKKADIKTLDGDQAKTPQTISVKMNFDKDGNVVDSKGNIIKTKAQFEQDKKKYTKEHPYTVEVGQDGKIIENGVPVAQSSEGSVQVAHIDENGNLVDDKGNILAKKADIKTLDGEQAKTPQTISVKMNFDKDGNVVDSKGNIIMTKAQFEQDKKKYTKENPYTVEVSRDGKIIENGVPVSQISDPLSKVTQ